MTRPAYLVFECQREAHISLLAENKSYTDFQTHTKVKHVNIVKVVRPIVTAK